MRRPLYICVIAIVLAIPFKDCIAQVNGPAQPEFRKFQPVDLKDLVNEFTGSFTYSIPLITIPGPNGSDYPLTLNYTSGSSPNEAASWVGFGWNITTGAIIRNKKGWPDDYKNVKINFVNIGRPNYTASSSFSYRLEYSSKDEPNEDPLTPLKPLDKNLSPSLGISKMHSFNTLTGFYKTEGLTLGVTGGFLKGANLSASLMQDSKDNYNISGSASYIEDLFRSVLIPSVKFNSDALNNYMGSTINGAINSTNARSLLSAASQYLSPTYGFQGTSTIFKPYHGTSEKVNLSLNLEYSFLKNEADFNLAAMDLTSSTTMNYDAPVYGYMYSVEAEQNKEAIMDYTVERDGHYEKRDLFLGIPYSGADNFEVTGADVQGGFRLYQGMVGCFRPNYTESITKIWGWGAAAGVVVSPLGYNFGADGNEGRQVMRIGGWALNKNSFYTGYWYHSNNKFFRFTNDLGGSLLLADYSDDFSLYHSSIFDSLVLDIKFHENYDPIKDKDKFFQYLPHSLKSDYSGTAKSQSSQILYYTFGDYRNREYTDAANFHKDDYYTQKIHDFKGVKDNLIAGYSIKGKNGFTYNYGLPVFNRNEMEFTYGLHNDFNGTNEKPECVNKVYPPGVHNPLVVYKQLDTNNDYKRVATGHNISEPYAGQFLLTEILTSDYVDLTNNGPTEDDLGGYVKFNYKRSTLDLIKEDSPVILNKNQPHDNSPQDTVEYKKQHQNWYRWRTPFNGLNYQKNSISDPQDDVGSMSAGETEIYYLESIETKTYIAYFITNKSSISIRKFGKDTLLVGSFLERKDGYSASQDEYSASASDEEGCPTNDSKNLLRFLERIELYSKEIKNPIMAPADKGIVKVAELLQTTHFEYDSNYPIWAGQPNSQGNELLPTARLGKLTLKRVWSESGTAKDYEINPYVFGYKYQTFSYPPEYSDIDNYGKNFVAPEDISNSQAISQAQAPYYNHQSVDRWGAYCSTEYLTNYGRYSVSQKREGTYRFDPAVYNLKTISLPSGGQIHVQYEQNRYSYVQRNNACVLAPIASATGKMKEMTLIFDVESTYGCSGNITHDVGREAADILNEKYVASPDDTLYHELSLLYCKLLFRQTLSGSASPDPLNSRNYEYIDGYIKPKSAIYIPDSKTLAVTFNISDIGEKGRQFFKANRYHLFDNNYSDDTPPGKDLYNHPYRSKGWACGKATEYIYTNTISYSDDLLYQKFSYPHSYVRLPVPPNWSKLGGGIRVKRILMFDDTYGPEFVNKSTLYGSEYFYEDEKGQCSGVASNEPSLGREENALVNMLKIKSKSSASPHYAGDLSFTGGPRDLEQGEGPIGEYLLPGPSVGYSSVYQKSIISGRRGNNIRNDGGVVRKQYFTTKDYPMLKAYSDVMKTEKPFPSLNSMYSVTTNNIRCSQGYRFILNNMSGQPKSVETFAGSIFRDALGNTIFNYLEKTPASKTEYEYYDFMKPIPIYDGQLMDRYWGVDEEIVTESRHIQDHYNNKKLEGDISFTDGFIPSNISLAYQKSIVNTDLHMHVINKILRMPVFLKSITTTTDGITKKVTQYGFDRNTGRALLTSTPDIFVGSLNNSFITNYYNSIIIPASQVSSGMTQSSVQKAGFIEPLFKSGPLYQVCRRIDYNSEENKNEYSLIFAVNTLKTGDTPGVGVDSTEEYLGGFETQYTQMYDPGDILKILPSRYFGNPGTSFYEDANSASGAEIYRVLSQKGHIIKLEPLSKDYESVYPPSKMISDVIITKKASMNLLNEDYASFVTYGPDAKNHLKNINKEYLISKEDSDKRKQFNNFLNYALYSATDANPSSPYTMSYMLQEYAKITNTPLSSLTWKFEGLELEPTTISSSNIDKFFTIGATRVDGCSIPSENLSGVSVYHDTLRILLFPNNSTTTSQNLTNLSHPFLNLVNAVIDSINTMRLDETIPDVNWEEVSNKDNPLSQELINRIFDITGYSRVKNYSLYFDVGDFRWYGPGFGKSFKKGKDIFNIDPSSLRVGTTTGENGIFITQANCNITDIENNTSSIGLKGSTAQFKFNAGSGVLYYGDSKAIGTIFSNKTTIPPDTVKVTLFWSRDEIINPEDFIVNPEAHYEDNVILYNEKSNSFSLFNFDFIPDFKRFVNESTNVPYVLTKKALPRSWFWADLTALKFCTQNDTLIQKADFAIKGNNRLISGSIKYFDDNWPNPEIITSIESKNADDPFSKGEKGKYRLKAEYNYDDLIDDLAFSKYSSTIPAPIPSAVLKDATIHKALQYPLLESFQMFNANYLYRDSIKDKWYKNIEITKRLSDGRIVEYTDNNEIRHSFFYGYPAFDEDDLHNVTAIKRGDDFISVYAYNAGYSEVLYQPWTHGISEENAHSGNCDSNFRGAAYPEVVRGLKLGENSLFDGIDYSKGLLSRVWIKDKASNPDGCNLKTNLVIFNNWPAETPSMGFDFDMTKICQTGEWSLYEAEIRDDILTNYVRSINEPNNIYVTASLRSLRPDIDSLVFDDFIIQPISSVASAYMYNFNNRRMSIMFDANHFATYYSYNDIGNPDKVHKETLAGYRTVAQSEFYTPGEDRFDGGPMLTNSIRQINSNATDELGVGIEERMNIIKGNELTHPNTTSIRLKKKNTQQTLDDIFFNEANSPLQEYKNQFDIFDLKLSPDGQDIKIMNSDFNKDSLDNFIKGIQNKIEGQIPDSVNRRVILKDLIPTSDVLKTNNLTPVSACDSSYKKSCVTDNVRSNDFEGKNTSKFKSNSNSSKKQKKNAQINLTRKDDGKKEITSILHRNISLDSTVKN